MDRIEIISVAKREEEVEITIKDPYENREITLVLNPEDLHELYCEYLAYGGKKP